MMRRLLWTLFFLILSVWIGLKIAADPGMALFAWQHWSVEMPLWFALISLIILLVITYAIFRFFWGVDSSWHALKNWWRWRRKKQSYSQTNRGLIELLEGQWQEAKIHLLKGTLKSDAPLLNYLAAAKAAHEMKDYENRDHYLQKAHQIAPEENIAIGLTQAQLQLQQGQVEQALATLNQLGALAPKQTLALKLLERLYVHIGDWKSVLKILPALRQAKFSDKVYLDKLEQRMYQELLKAAASKAKNQAAIQEVWLSIPRKLQKSPQVLECYLTQLLPYPDAANESVVLINKILKRQWNSELARLYGLFVTTDEKKQLSRAEQYLKHYPAEPILLLTLGRLCVRCQLWGKARHYFEDSLTLQATPSTYAEYGKLLEQMGDTQAALTAYRAGCQQAVCTISS